jgi:hypothetical protein
MVSLITAMNAGSSAFTMQSASWLIEQLFATPKPTAAPAPARSNGATMIAAARDEAARLARRAPIGLTEDQVDSWYQEQALDAEDRAERLEAMQP